MNPVVSVIMPVYNGEEYLYDAVNSILKQNYRNFELIIIDDGSSDNSYEIIKSFSDVRIRSFRQKNSGLAETLNTGIQLAKGEFIARQDQDDISHATRFEKQVNFLESSPRVGLVGTWAHIWVDSIPSKRIHKHSISNCTLQFELLFDNPFVHSSVMMRKSVVEQVGYYSIDKNRQPPEDYELWSRIARKYEVANIPEILVVYRETSNSMSRTGKNPFLKKKIMISVENFEWLLDSHDKREQIKDLVNIFNLNFEDLSTETQLMKVNSILNTAIERLDKEKMSLQYISTFYRKKFKLNILYIFYKCNGRITNTIIELYRKIKGRFDL